jgi:ribosomal protein L12E/L44/L45/RPP1/RPP2
MSELAEMIERVVREVLAQLGHTVVAAAVPPAEPRANGATAPPAAQSTKAVSHSVAPTEQEASDSLVINRRVVTMADLPERLAAIRRMIVPLGAVVTPAVQDELQQRHIKLVVDEPSRSASKPASAVLMVAAATYDPASLVSALEREGFAVEPRRMDCLIRATDQLAADLASCSTMGLLVTAYPSAAVCLANRHAGVRAILGLRADTVAGDAASLGANLLVVDPTVHGFFAVKQMAGRFLRGGPRSCPEVFQKRLG